MTGRRPNLLYVFADQLRGQDLGCAGNRDVSTPTIDRLAAEGVRCTRAYANSPVCTPSRGTLLTGQYPLTNRVVANDLPLPVDAPTVSATLAAAGYRTGYVGKWHLDGVPRSRFTPPGPRRHGFEFWAAYNCSHAYYRREKFYRDSPEPVLLDGYEPQVQTAAAAEFLAEPDDRPFCLFLSWGPPHDPYDKVPPEYRARYDPAALTLRPNVRDIPEGTNRLAAGLRTRDTLANYYAAITALDDQLAVLLDRLDSLGLADDTVVVFASDHGDMLWSQGKMKKQQPWEESVNVPFVVRWPGHLPAGRVSDGLLGMVDVAPTLLGLLGVPADPRMEGRDRSGLLRGTAGGADSVLLMDVVPLDESPFQGIGEWRGVRTARHTYVTGLGGRPWLLYDNDADPYQLVNLVDDPGSRETRDRLAAELAGWLARTGDPFVSGPEHLRLLGLQEEWNARERELHPAAPAIL